MKLWDYQLEGIEFLRKQKKAYIAFEPGMGKTITSIAGMKDLAKRHVLLIAEKTEIVNSENFRKEVDTYFPDMQYRNLREEPLPIGSETRTVCGINPDGLAKLDPDEVGAMFDSVIVDEATLAKTTTTVRFKRVRKVCDKANYVALLSGTPMMNGASEIFAPLVIMGHWLGGDGTKKSREAFETIFAGGYKKRIRYTGIFWQDFQWWAKGANNLRELRWLTREAFTIKQKGETTVFKKKDRRVEEVEMDPEWCLEYARAWDDYIEKVKEHNSRAKVPDMKSIDNIKELQAVIENGQVYQVNSKRKARIVARDIAAGKYGTERIVVYTMYIESDKILQDELTKLGVSFRTFEDQDEWKKGTEQVLVGRLKSHSKGANLPQASVALFVDMDYVPTNNLQAENRIDRPEQTRDMTVRYYMAGGEGIIDRHVQKIVADKMRKIEKFMAPFTPEEEAEMPVKVGMLIEKYGKEFRTLKRGAERLSTGGVNASL